MAIFRKTAFYTTCDLCGAAFGAGKGGVCAECRRILCNAHLQPSLLDRLRGAFGTPPRIVCPQCRAKASHASA